MVGRRPGGMSALVLGLLLAARPALGQVRAVELSMDNDGFSFWLQRPTDWFYTDGTFLEVRGDWKLSGPASLGIHGASCSSAAQDRPCVVTRVRLGQKIFTPEDLFFYEPGVVDRPYAGWLYLMLGRERLTPRRTTDVSVQVGVTGNPSLARQMQETLHGLLGLTEPRGWQYQIPFEVDFAGIYRDTWHLPVTRAGRPLSLDVEPDWAATLGTERTSGQTGLFLRLGWRAPVGSMVRGPGSRQFYVVARMGEEGEWVLRDLFLDGSTWRHSISTPKEPLVGRTRAALDVGWDRMDMHLAVTRSTREFRAQDAPHLFGTIALRVRR
jgi:lipid A 3-O-deacylase